MKKASQTVENLFNYIKKHPPSDKGQWTTAQCMVLHALTEDIKKASQLDALQEAETILQTTPVFTEPLSDEKANLDRDHYFHHVLDTISKAILAAEKQAREEQKERDAEIADEIARSSKFEVNKISAHAIAQAIRNQKEAQS